MPPQKHSQTSNYSMILLANQIQKEVKHQYHVTETQYGSSSPIENSTVECENRYTESLPKLTISWVYHLAAECQSVKLILSFFIIAEDHISTSTSIHCHAPYRVLNVCMSSENKSGRCGARCTQSTHCWMYRYEIESCAIKRWEIETNHNGLRNGDLIRAHWPVSQIEILCSSNYKLMKRNQRRKLYVFVM